MSLARNAILCLSFIAAGSQLASAQAPANASAIHTVSVFIPPRLKVSVVPVASHVANEAGLALNVRGTQPWTVAVSRRRAGATSSSSDAAVVAHGVDLKTSNARVPASFAAGASSASVILRAADAASSDSNDEIVLSVAAR